VDDQRLTAFVLGVSGGAESDLRSETTRGRVSSGKIVLRCAAAGIRLGGRHSAETTTAEAETEVFAIPLEATEAVREPLTRNANYDTFACRLLRLHGRRPRVARRALSPG